MDNEKFTEAMEEAYEGWKAEGPQTPEACPADPEAWGMCPNCSRVLALVPVMDSAGLPALRCRWCGRLK